MKITEKLKMKVRGIRALAAVRHSEFFDAGWYRRTYGKDVGNPARHYCKSGWLMGYDPSGRFSTSEYLEVNPDVKERGTNPLAHYELYGKKEGRKPETTDKYIKTMPGEEVLYTGTVPAGLKKCAVFASYSEDGTIPDYVVYYLRELSKVTDGIVFIADNRLADKAELEKIKEYVFHAEFTRHGTFDFGSWKKGLQYLQSGGLLENLDELVLANDSCYGPAGGFESVFEKMRGQNVDFWGLVDSEEPQYHILSFFYVLGRRVLQDSSYLLRFFDRINGKPMSFWGTVIYCEREFSVYLKEKYSCGCLLSGSQTEKMALTAGNFNPTLWPLTMLRQGLPLVKIKCFDGRFGYDCHENPDRVLDYIRRKNPELYSIIKADLGRRLKASPKTFRGLLDDYCLAMEDKELVSFDVFDTLISRTFCSPSDLFRYMESRYEAPGFAAERILAEKRAHLDSCRGEITLDEIYEHILPQFRHLKAEEFRTELECAKPNYRVLELYEQAAARGKKIIAVSDMYLPGESVKDLAFRCGYPGIDKYFVSSELMKTKGSGLLYPEVLKETGVSPEKAIHFGDNEEADVSCARAAGIEAYRTSKLHEYFLELPANYKYKKYMRSCGEKLSASIWLSLVADYFSRLTDDALFHSCLGYTLGGPLALGYVDYICRKAKANGAEHILFTARDGWVLKAVYERFFYPDYNIPCSYAYLNRSTVISALPGEPEKESYLRTLLELARDAGIGVSVYGSEEKNRAEYRAHKAELEQWKAKNADVLKRTLEQACGEAKTVAAADMVTSGFTSLTGAAALLEGRTVFGIFSAVFFNGKTTLPWCAWCERALGTDISDNLPVRFSEFLITSPEDPVAGLDENGNPVFSRAADGERKDRTARILQGIEEYCSDFLKHIRSCPGVLFSFEEWAELVRFYAQYCNEADLHYLGGVTDTSDPTEKQGRKKITDIIFEYRQQKLKES